MKKYLLLLLLLSSLTGFSQTVTDSTEREQYCIVRTYYSGRNLIASADFGQKPSRRVFEVNFVKDEAGKPIQFYSEVDALNYFGLDGWKLVNAFPDMERGSGYTRYIFKRMEKW